MSLKKQYQLSLLEGLIKVNLDPTHELIQLGERIDWGLLRERLGTFYSEVGRPGKPLRLLVGLQLLKHLYNLSDEAVVSRLTGDLYFRVFCGVDSELGQWTQPVDPSTLTYFRQRLGAEGMRIIEELVLGHIISEKRVNKNVQIVDSTVMEKNIQYPTDVRLLNKGRELIVSSLKRLKRNGAEIAVGRSFSRTARRLVVLQGKLRNTDDPERLTKTKRCLIAYGRKVFTNAQRALKRLSKYRKPSIAREREKLKQLLDLYQRVISQTERGLNGLKTHGRVYSFVEPHVTAIGRGKLSKRFEFGSVVTISADNNGFVICHQEYDQNINDVKTLEPAVRAWEKATGSKPRELAGDRGYSSTKHSEYVKQIKRIGIPCLGVRKGQNEHKTWFKRLRRRRVSIEAIIGHLKSEHRFNRCRYRGFQGDRMNVYWAVLAWNCRKWVRT